jgi:Fe-S cluster assembly protein SufD
LSVDLAPQTASLDPNDFPLPTGREEEWRFAPMEQLRSFLDVAPGAGSVVADPSAYVSIVSVDDIDDTWLPTDRAAAIARAHVQQVVMVRIADDHVVDEPILIDLRAPTQQSYLHLVVEAGRHSRATVVVRHDLGADVSGAMVTNLADGADLSMVSLCDGGRGKQLIHWPASIGRDARFTGVVVNLDGSFIRIRPTAHYRSSGGAAELLGVFLADGEHFFEHRVFVEHETPHCSSNVMYKGALSGDRAHTVWIGDVLVRRTAIGTDTYEMNRNLLLSDGPRADSVPNLELETGDVVGAGHASATGRFDDDQLFYLMSRGISEGLARQLVVRGFFADVLNRLPDAQWRQELMERIDARLGIVAHE